MARSHAIIRSAVWSDPDLAATVSLEAWGLYTLLCCHPETSMVGRLNYLPRQWARQCAGLTVAKVEKLVKDLEAARLVVVDRDTDELLIRTMVRHDGVTKAPNLVAGLWSAWSAIRSTTLRDAVLVEMPDAVWESKAKLPEGLTRPSGAGPVEGPPDPPVEGRSEGRSKGPVEGLPTTFHLPPTTTTTHVARSRKEGSSIRRDWRPEGPPRLPDYEPPEIPDALPPTTSASRARQARALTRSTP